jgi:hypothetical protein
VAATWLRRFTVGTGWPVSSTLACRLLRLHELYILSLGAFGSLTFRERYSLSLAQFLKADALQVRGVKKQVFLFSRADEAESFVHQTLNRSFSHCEPSQSVEVFAIDAGVLHDWMS